MRECRGGDTCFCCCASGGSGSKHLWGAAAALAAARRPPGLAIALTRVLLSENLGRLLSPIGGVAGGEGNLFAAHPVNRHGCSPAAGGGNGGVAALGAAAAAAAAVVL